MIASPALLRARAVSVVCFSAATAMACQPELDCTAPTAAGFLSIDGPNAAAEMKNFCDDHPHGAAVEFLTISATTLVHLDMPCMCRITDSLLVQDNSELVDLTGLESLTGIDGGLIIERNAKLRSLTGLPLDAPLGAIATDQSIVITDNPALLDLEGLPQVNTSLPGLLAIDRNPRLTSLAGLPPGVTSVQALRIVGNDGLLSLTGLPPKLTTIAGSLSIGANPRLRDLTGLPSGLTRIDDTFALIANEALTSLSGVPPNLTSIGGELMIASHPQLVDLTGLPDGLVIAGQLQIRKNGLLRDLSGLPADLGLGADSWTGDSLIIAKNDNLLTLSGLPDAATKLPGNLVLADNPNLVDLSSLAEVDRIAGSLTISGNHGLIDLTGLSPGLRLGVDALGASLVITENAGLEHLTGFPAEMQSLPGGLGIARNDRLRDLSGLEPLREVAGDLVIGRSDAYNLGDPCDWELDPAGNASVQDLTGLANLRTIEGTLAILCNPALQDLASFAALQTIAGDLILLHNPALTGLGDLGGATGSLTALGGAYQVLCSPLLAQDEVLAVLDNLVEPAPLLIQLQCD